MDAILLAGIALTCLGFTLMVATVLGFRWIDPPERFFSWWGPLVSYALCASLVISPLIGLAGVVSVVHSILKP